MAPLPHRPRIVEQRAGHQQRGLGVAHPERGEALELLGQAEVQGVAGHDGVDPLDGDEVGGRQRRRGVRDERLAERLHAAALDRQPRGGAVPAVAQEVRAGGLQAAEQVERRDRASRARSLLAVERDQHGRAMMALGDPRRDDPDHARMPAVGGEDVGSGARRARGDELLGLEQDPRLHVAPLDVDGVELGGDGARALDVGGQQQLQARVGAVQAPRRVDPRGEPEADRAGVDPARVDAGDLHQRLQPGLAGRGERAQALAHQAAVLADERHAVGDRRERHEIEVGIGVGRVRAGALQQGAGEHVRDARRAQLGARVATDGGVHDRRVRQPAVGPRRMVVGDHDVEPGGARGGDLVDGRDRAVDGDQQAGAASGEPLDRREREPVAVVDPARQVPVDVGAERAQRTHQHGRRADAVDVVVAVHGDPRAARDVGEDPRRALAQAAEGVERMTHVGGEERARRLGLAEPAPDQHLRRDMGDAQRLAEPLGGGVVVGRDLQAYVRRRHSGTV